MSSELPTPPIKGNGKDNPRSKRSASPSRQRSNRRTKREIASLYCEQSGGSIDGGRKRIWRACERCRMKKTKCDEESPCKRCKDDGLVCIGCSRNKTSFRKLSTGYAEVLENTQHILIATVQKLYTMLRNGESWEFGDSKVNDHGIPVIQHIAQKLGCIRHSPGLPYAFPVDAEDFAKLREQSNLESGGDEAPKPYCSTYSSSAGNFPTDCASLGEPTHLEMPKDYNQLLRNRQQEQVGARIQQDQFPLSKSQLGQDPFIQTKFAQESFSLRTPSNSKTQCATWPLHSDLPRNFDIQLPDMQSDWSINPWFTGDEILGPACMLDLTAMHMPQEQFAPNIPRSTTYSTRHEACGADAVNTNRDDQVYEPNMPSVCFSDHSVRPNMLHCITVSGLNDETDNSTFPQNIYDEAETMHEWIDGHR